MGSHTDAYIKAVQDFINQRPRKVFNRLTPYETHFAPPHSPKVRT